MSQDGYFDAEVAAGYDEEHRAAGDLDACIDFLADLAAGRRVLEFAIGTGRVALPLAAKGIEVAGSELSQPMIDQLRAKPGGEAIEVVRGDMASAKVTGRFGMVFLVFNTICNLTTQEAQIACFRNAADHLDPGGHFVIETFVPQIRKLGPGETRLPFDESETHSGYDEFDNSKQSVVSHHIWKRGQETVRRSMPFRYVWPAELDLMAQMAGMRLVERWEDWDRSPFTHASGGHVSVWQMA